MKIRRVLAVILAMAELFLLAGCGQTREDSIVIAVIGDEADLYPGYREGADTAAEELRRTYDECGLEIKYQFYSYDGSYEEGSAIVDMLAADETVTAVVGGTDMDLNKTAAYVLNKAGAYAITLPGWEGELPDGVTRVDVPTATMWSITRTVLSGNEDLPNVYAIQEQMQLLPLSAYVQGGEYTAPQGAYKEENDFVPVNKVLSIDRYCINDRSDFKLNADGTLDIILSKDAPEDTSNWLPVSDGEFHLFMRIYVPDMTALDSWQPPVIREQ